MVGTFQERPHQCLRNPAKHATNPRKPKRRIISATASGCASAFIPPEPTALSDYELLEMVLFAAQPRRDMKPLAKKLIAKFGSFAEVIHAPETRLREIKGVGDGTINGLKLIAAAAHRVETAHRAVIMG
jgi:hypothetical protein